MIADRSRNTSRLIGQAIRVSQRERRSIAGYEPIDRAPVEGRDSVIADRSENLLMHNGVVFQTFYSEFPPKLGQSMCSINGTQFGRKRKNFEREKNSNSHEETQEEEEQVVAWRRRLKKAVEE